MPVNTRGITAAAMSGIGLALALSVINGLSTYVLPEGQTIQQWTLGKVA